jgi:hypothetical protein
MKGGATIEGAICGRGVARRAKWVEQGRPKPKKQGRRMDDYSAMRGVLKAR